MVRKTVYTICMNESIKRLGVLGGTFNPIHNGHVQMAQMALAALDLSAVLLMTAKQPPHKAVSGAVSEEHRFCMTALAAGAAKAVTACDMELKRSGKSYTIDTVRELRQMYPESELFWIVGSDMLFDLPNWYQAQSLMQEVQFICVPRLSEQGGEAQQIARLSREYGARIHLLEHSVQPVSSTDIRNRVFNAMPVINMLPESVLWYIYQNGLYFPEDVAAMQEKCRSMLKESRYLHTVGVMITAIRLAKRYGVDTKQARLAALLHDCGRSTDASALGHAEASARLAREQFGVTDEAVLQAVSRHTVAGTGMTALDQIIYLSDMIEPGRSYPGVEELRALAEQSLQMAYLEGLRHTVAYVKLSGQPLHAASVAALAEAEQTIKQ
ncbi:MAG: nicotinate-nucleotide adenylyltransferase [Eubacteriales bacterium]|nr:nicotinate-nucleotide adenylyltransferase [Eubacteriales bacterium]